MKFSLFLMCSVAGGLWDATSLCGRYYVFIYEPGDAFGAVGATGYIRCRTLKCNLSYGLRLLVSPYYLLSLYRVIIVGGFLAGRFCPKKTKKKEKALSEPVFESSPQIYMFRAFPRPLQKTEEVKS